ncbi:MAG: serine/threonine-protein phosphatase, partial [Spirochaetales bacterium]|nr:serine/threonine-protein phosphatase [Spirochaetales bacterium]
GDFYDFLNYGGKNAVMIGDVSGHGVTPGLITMIAQSIIYSLTTQNGDIHPDQLFIYLNQLLMRSIHNLGINIFVTICLLQEVEDGVFRGVGKHNDILVYRAKTDTVDVIQTEGVWLCMAEDVSNFIKEYEVSIDKGDIMMLYTDGLSEGANANNECFDTKLCDLLKKYADQPAENILNNIMNDYVEFIETQDDDVTLLIIKK